MGLLKISVGSGHKSTGKKSTVWIRIYASLKCLGMAGLVMVGLGMDEVLLMG